MTSAPEPTRLLAAAGEVVCWWLVTAGVWLLTLSTITSAELGVALSCGLVCGLAARAGRRALGGGWALQLRWTRWLGLYPVALLADAGRILALALRSIGPRSPSGQVRTVALRQHDRAALRAGHQAAATLMVSSTPASVVIDADPDENTLTVHALVAGEPQLQEVVKR